MRLTFALAGVLMVVALWISLGRITRKQAEGTPVPAALTPAVLERVNQRHQAR
jgi:hypothetical protein